MTGPRIALALVALLALAAPTASARTRELPRDGAPPAGHVPDRVISGGARAAVASRPARSVRTFDGQSVEVTVSRAYDADPEADRALVDFLASRVHGWELGRLKVFVGSPREVRRLCGGGDVVACYATGEARMYVPGERVRAAPLGYVITHEYGHHLAASRRNDPWDALDWGPKHWASAVRVCTHAAAGRLFPGNPRRYFADPGEGFADGYARMHGAGVRWRFGALMRPLPRIQRAIRRDVLRPWTGPRTRVLSGGRGAAMRLRLRLDGDLTLGLSADRGSRWDVQVRTDSPGSAGAYAVGQTMRPGGEVGIEWCRRSARERVIVSVRRRAGGGRFSLRVGYPG